MTCSPGRTYLGEGANYNIDFLAIEKVVQLVERVSADHRSEVHDAEALQALIDLCSMCDAKALLDLEPEELAGVLMEHLNSLSPSERGCPACC